MEVSVMGTFYFCAMRGHLPLIYVLPLVRIHKRNICLS